jgi:hypothetical protein
MLRAENEIDGSYAGFETLTAMEKAETDNDDRPLKDIKIKYGDEAVMSTFYDEDGPIPTKIVMDLSFSELEILTSDRMPWTGGGAAYQP